MGAKKKNKQDNKAVTETVETQEKQKEPEASVEKEPVGVPEIKEIQEIKTGGYGTETGENVTEKKRKKLSVGSVLFGFAMTAVVAFIAVCLYKTASDLQNVQIMSMGLQTELDSAEKKIEKLLVTTKNLQEVSNVREEVTKEPDEAEMQEETDMTGMETDRPKPTPEPEGYMVCIDAGHGAHDTGAVLEREDGTRRNEKDDNLWLAKLVRDELETYGVKVIMTREDDSFLELYDRTLVANGLDVDALISFHRNAYYLNGKMNDRVGGVEIWIHSSRPTASRQLANSMLDAILDVGGMEDRGVRYGSMTDFNEDYAINRRSLMPSMIVEMGFISNEGDNEALDTNGEAYAKAMAKEIYDWLVRQD